MSLDNFYKKESPLISMLGMGGGASSLLTLASGEVTYVDEVFSTFLYEGTGSAQTITNGIDLDGEGGMVWVKCRNSSSFNHQIGDTERGVNNNLSSDTSAQNYTHSGKFTAFNSDGFTLGNNGAVNNSSSQDYCSWTFRKCPGFFDIVTYTGNGVAGRTVAHNLGSVPGCIMIKCLDVGRDWIVYHRGLDSSSPEDYYVVLNSTASRTDNSIAFNDTAPTDTEFTLGTYSAVNGDGNSYIAYIFAHNDGSFGESSDEAVIKCGSYTGNILNGPTVDLGFEPQWILTRSASTAGPNWYIFDNMREWTADGDMIYLRPDTLDAESSLGGSSKVFNLNSRGFKVTSESTEFNKTNDNFIYIAIRRPHKPPEAGTDVFAIDTKTAKSGNTPQYTSGFPVDLLIRRNQIDSTDYPEFQTRLTSKLNYISEVGSGWGEGGDLASSFAFNNGVGDGTSARATDYHWMFKRAPGFLDVLNYSGTGSSGLTVNHNLGTTPELLIYKNRTSTGTNWFVITASQYGNLNNSNAFSSQSFISFGSSSYTINTTGNSTNASGQDYIAYLFGSVDGVSKIGSYSGSSSDVNVDCGFTSGARFVLIKRTDATGDWCLFDTSRGIVSGNDTRLVLNGSSAQDNGNDLIDPLSSGFTVVGGNTSINGASRTYLFLAIA